MSPSARGTIVSPVIWHFPDSTDCVPSELQPQEAGVGHQPSAQLMLLTTGLSWLQWVFAVLLASLDKMAPVTNGNGGRRLVVAPRVVPQGPESKIPIVCTSLLLQRASPNGRPSAPRARGGEQDAEGAEGAGSQRRRVPMPAANMMENLQLPALQVPEPQGVPDGSPVWSSSSTPTLRRRRFKMRRMKNVQEQSLEAGLAQELPGVLAPGKEFLQLPSIEITPSSDEDTPWSNCSTPSASPRRKRFLLRKWLRVRERKECSESSCQMPEQLFYWCFASLCLLILAEAKSPRTPNRSNPSLCNDSPEDGLHMPFVEPPELVILKWGPRQEAQRKEGPLTPAMELPVAVAESGAGNRSLS
ncbi:hypothetical protein J0S82_007897 [Galemys pyrenaicus]|uniref:Protein Aster-B n=1 Tax=Galemys pyrenaicus TaxID=202257 RepID=A0A8J6BEK9_GALPY|nr:hypothetical protein J0S82_007897 [Galemys pyrenaicus]